MATGSTTTYEYRSSSSTGPVTNSYNAQTQSTRHIPPTTFDQEALIRPVMSHKSIVVNRTSSGGLHQPNSYGRNISAQANMASAASLLPFEAYVNLTNTGVTAVKESRVREKKDMQDLNERFANYLEKVRFLEAQNKSLADELGKLKSRWGKETEQIKSMYTAELDEARHLLDEAIKDKARLEIRAASLEDEIASMTQRLNIHSISV